MAAELSRVQKDFVDRVNDVIIDQLLDDILNYVLNDGEVEAIRSLLIRADKARKLINIVKMKKDDDASWTFIASLEKRDRTLHKSLGLPSVSRRQPSQPAAAAPKEQERSLGQPSASQRRPSEPAAGAPKEPEWSPALIHTTEDFWSEKQEDETVYPAAKKSIWKRMALLITNIEFKDEDMNRYGADKDEENMEDLLIELGYEVVKCTDRTGKNIDEEIIKFSKHKKLKDTDSVFVVIMSHGEQHAVYGVDFKKKDKVQDKFLIDNIYKRLGTASCPALKDKPKIILIQACSGGKKGSVPASDSATSAVVSDDAPKKYLSLSAGEQNIQADSFSQAHREKDFICLRSSTPGTVAYRDKEKGSLFIQHIVKVLNTFAHKDHIEDLFKTVMRSFEKLPIETEEGEDKQMPTTERGNMPRYFYLFPGILIQDPVL
ncbi:caspase a-like isoform X1 [Scomber scombrus]|uniref:caspase a-like isoform X1 n=1 Tax=Scomber scombrus TaxID=13677 RepID=UPI002DDB976D|nr:caspase a-like isoform X1 [Scomber scombrus]XP_062297039.1 caspase a-like isoform X1 [Scomber scombrus]